MHTSILTIYQNCYAKWSTLCAQQVARVTNASMLEQIAPTCSLEALERSELSQLGYVI